MLYGSANIPFFISASPALRAEASHVGPDAMKDLSRFLTSMDMHELTHTLQLPYVAKQMEDLQAKGNFPEHLNDNLIEDEFKTNEEFRKMRNAELQAFSAGVMAQNRAEAAANAAKGLRLLDERWKRFFVGKHARWGQMEDVFLALEGSGMWMQYQTALRLAPPKQPPLETLRILSQRTDAWSQSEGLGLFLLMEKLNPD